MNYCIFLLSIVFSSLGALFDWFSICLFFREGAGKIERNVRTRNAFRNEQFGKDVLLEVILILIFGIVDFWEISNWIAFWV